MSTKNSFISLLEQISILNKNSVEIITKMNLAVSTPQSNVTINMVQPDGTTSSFQMPTIGYLKDQIDVANSNIKRLANLQGDGSTIIIDGKSSKKVFSVDLNREPQTISSLNPVTQFTPNVNWFFESLMNPILSVNVDLAGRIDDQTNRIISRRYIVKFEKDTAGNLTTRGLNAQTDFQTNFLNRSDITLNEFITWYTNPTNGGTLNSSTPEQTLDEQMFDLNYRQINYRGVFSVLKIETDTINNKVWYHVDKLTYVGIDGSIKNLTLGDELILNNKNTMSRYAVREINTASSLNRISLETVEGYDAVPIGQSVLKYYSTLSLQKSVKITVGFDEYNVVFVKPINTENMVIGAEWSKGFAYYTNDLTLDTDSNVNLSNYYIDTVYDYGSILKDMVIKNIPSEFGVTPNKPNLIEGNFKVLQINKHLTDTLDSDQLKKLSGQKNTSKSKISQINDAIIEKNKELNTKVFKSIAERSKSETELKKMINTHESETKMYSSVVLQLKNSIPAINVEPKFRVRGFWDLPDAIMQTGKKTQEVIGFEVQYKYKAKSGQENATEGFALEKQVAGTTAAAKKMGYYSNWIPFNTPVRERYYDETNNTWHWKAEDVADADKPNINQLDIPINPNEAVDIRVRSISEVGYPNTPLISDWCDTLTIPFPDELVDIVTNNDYVMKEATSEEMKVQFEGELSAKGINRHVQDAFYVNENYFAHPDKNIATSFKDSFGNTLSLYEYLRLLNDKISALEEAIKRSKGEMKVTLFRGTEEIEITNNSIYNIVVNCDDYNITTSAVTTYWARNYYNYIYVIQDFWLQIDNVSRDSDLGIFAQRTAASALADNGASVVNELDELKDQLAYQYLWCQYKDNTTPIYSGATMNSMLNTTTLLQNDFNLAAGTTAPLKITDDLNWWDQTLAGADNFMATVHPVVRTVVAPTLANELTIQNQNQTKIIRPAQSVKVPLNIYYKLDGKYAKTDTINIDTQTALRRNKKLKFYLEPESMNQAFNFTLKFTLIRNNTFPIYSVNNLMTYNSTT